MLGPSAHLWVVSAVNQRDLAVNVHDLDPRNDALGLRDLTLDVHDLALAPPRIDHP
ncbi:Uncharacterised protein [Brevibacterium casei]|uniref:Uncharacterized protein n=1 Tax=Brevibacterium casei TaxID=33889 RepID=A0A449D3K6_9MICO|nr:Uncharacterised protein [Brevibacterium casei]